VDPFELLRQANEAMRLYGLSRSQVEEKLPKLSNGQFNSIEELQAAVAAGAGQPTNPEEAAQKRLNETGGNAGTDFLHKAVQGLSLNTSDEAAGVLATGPRAIGRNILQAIGSQGLFVPNLTPEEVQRGTAAMGAERQRLGDLSTLAPGASFAAEMAGGLAVPAVGAEALGSRAAAATGRRALGGILGAAGAGAGYGAVAGVGAGETPGGRAVGGVVGGVAGGVLGSVFGGLGAGVQALAGKILSGRQTGALSEGAAYRLKSLLRDALKHAGLEPREIANRMKALDELATGGPPTTPADVSQVLRERVLPGAINEAPAVSRETSAVSAVRAGRTVPKPHELYAEFQDIPVVEGTFPKVESALKNPEVERAVRAAGQGRVLPGENTDAPNPLYEAIINAGGSEEFALKNAGSATVPNPDAKPVTVTDLQDALVSLRGVARRKTGYNTSGEKVGTEILPGEASRAQKAYSVLRGAMGKDIPGFDEAQRATKRANMKQRALDKTRRAVVKGASMKASEEGARRAGDVAPHATYAHGLARVLSKILGRGASRADIQAANEVLANMLVRPTTEQAMLRALAPRFGSPTGFAGGLLSAVAGPSANLVGGGRGILGQPVSAEDYLTGGGR